MKLLGDPDSFQPVTNFGHDFQVRINFQETAKAVQDDPVIVH
jgi:hypothetical protein